MTDLRLFANLRAPEVAARIGPASILVQPLGAVEQHGPHLPLSTDSIVATAVAEAAVAAASDDLDVWLVVNMVKDAVEARTTFDRIEAVCQKFLRVSPYYAGHVVADPRVGQAVRRRRPFLLESPNCAASVCIRQLANRLDRDAAEAASPGLLRRMVGWLAG